MAFDTAQALSIQAARTIDVGRGVVAGSSDTPLVRFDFEAGDSRTSPSINETGFSFGAEAYTTDGQSSPLGDTGIEFRYSATPDPSDDSTAELRYDLGGQYAEAWEKITYYIPENYQHRFIKVATVDDSADISTWEVGDIVDGGNGAFGTIYQILNNKVYFNNCTFIIYGDGYWRLTNLTNRSDSTVAYSESAYFEAANNKFSFLWQGTYSSGGIGIELIASYSNGIFQGSKPKVYSTSTDSHGTQSSSPSSGVEGFLIESSDYGKKVEYTIYRKRSTVLEDPDGVCKIWKNGALVYENYSMQLFDSTDNFFDKGYLLGYSNSGYENLTKFYLHKYEFWGANAPNGFEGAP